VTSQHTNNVSMTTIIYCCASVVHQVLARRCSHTTGTTKVEKAGIYPDRGRKLSVPGKRLRMRTAILLITKTASVRPQRGFLIKDYPAAGEAAYTTLVA
jgi:hypothetical protein